jgi:phage baseplate assembly protein W
VSQVVPEFLGQGWRFPVTLDATGGVALAAGEEDIREAIRLILGCNLFERVMRPDYGSDLRATVFEPMSAATVALARHRVETALVQWEPRIDSVSVTVRLEGPVGRLLLDVRYRVRASNTFYNLVYPFYLTEGAGP